MEVLNPATGEVIAEVPRGTAEDVDARRRGGEEGARRSGATRRRRTAWSCCCKLADLIDEHAEELGSSSR